jgi:putative Mn2+ efflux pump MntP
MKSPKPATDNSLNEHFALWQILSLIFCGIVVVILNMETGRNFAMSGINSGHHNLPTYEISLKLDNVEFERYCGIHFENGDR